MKNIQVNSPVQYGDDQEFVLVDFNCGHNCSG